MMRTCLLILLVLATTHPVAASNLLVPQDHQTIQAAIDEDVPAPVITMALFQRFVSRQDESFAAKVLAMMRKGFGGHAIKSN